MSSPYTPSSYPYWPVSYSNDTGGGSNGSANLATPIGNFEFTGSARNPQGHLMCDGAVYSQLAFPDLYLAIGDVYSGPSNNYYNKKCLHFDISNDFVVPSYVDTSGNSISRFPLGGTLASYGTGAYAYTDVSGGASQVVLDISNIPMHEHQLTRYGGTQTTGLANGGFDPQTGTILIKTECELYDCSGNLAQSGPAQPFPVIPNFMKFNALIRANSPDSSALVGYTTITTQNDRFYINMLGTACNFPTPGTTDFETFAVTLKKGNFTRPQFLSNIAASIKSSVNSFSNSSYFNIEIASCTLDTYKISPQGLYTMALNIDYAPLNNSGIGFVQFVFNTSNNIPSYGVYGAIPQDVLDRTADTMGFMTRSVYPGLPNNYITSYSVNSNFSPLSNIVPPKAMKINWNGSVQNGDYSLSNFGFISYP